ncbi:MAG: DUF998 domain-containing protein [Candidatus Lokiarchaeota archaeon]|nr:DUF998 domain-containing protein [Candidatus Lokiarchaeota archaeon]
MKSNKKPVLLSYFSLICVVILFIIIIFFHLFRTDHDPLLQTMSEYTIGPWGIFLPISLLILGLSSFLSAFAIGLILPVTSQTKKSLRALQLWALFITIAGIFPTDYITGPYSFSGIMHGVASCFAFLFFPISLYYISQFYRKEVGSTSDHYRYQIYFYACLTGFIFYIISPLGYKGIAQRIFLGIIIIAYIDLISIPLRTVNKN